MPKRLNLPYTTQDLFPQSNTSPSKSNGAPASSTRGSIISTPSSIYIPRSTLHQSKNGSSGTSGSASTGVHFENRFKTIRTMIKRLFKPTTLDFETAIWEIFHLIVNPRKMYRSHYYYRQQQQQSNPDGKTSYSRDDPSFLILVTGFLCISAVAWGLAYSPNFWDILKLIVYMVLVDFYLSGVVIATVTWLATNKLFNLEMEFSRYSVYYIEWGFCFDIHCNSFLIIWCLLYVVQFILLPIIRIRRSLIALILGNSLYFGSIAYYFVVSFYGFNSLPIISSNIVKSSSKNPARVLQLVVVAGIIPLLALTWLTTILLRIKVADRMIDYYFD
ncbi:uncharacterized protein LODBEIA_P13060 [Lodderomyces beijingensis]|uniref:Protein GMH1 n=1 Tax=Lodderomyces beijingensis TaxID=1775926 RepID=A0ABP0ZLL1_9ASCO